MTNKTIVGIFALLFSLIVGTAFFLGKKSAPGVDTKLVTALQDSLRVTRDSAGRETAKRLQLESDVKSINALLQGQSGLLKDKDEQIKRLMKATSKTKDGIYVSVVTKDSIKSSPTEVDTLNHIYHYKGEDKWFSYDATASKQDLYMRYTVSNEYVMKHDKVKNGIETTITNLNPHTSTKEVISYTTQIPKPKRIAIGPVVGVGVNSINPTKPSIFIGVGVTYSLIRF